MQMVEYKSIAEIRRHVRRIGARHMYGMQIAYTDAAMPETRHIYVEVYGGLGILTNTQSTAIKAMHIGSYGIVFATEAPQVIHKITIWRLG